MEVRRPNPAGSTGAVLVAAIGSLLFAACAQAQPKTAPAPTPAVTTTKTINTSPSTLSVKGYSELHKPADQVMITVGVISEAAEAGGALADNSGRMRRIVDAIGKVGLGENEFQTGRFQIRPQYSRRPRQATADWKPSILGYEVTNTLVIRTKRLQLAADLIEAAHKAGANSIDRLQFTLADPRAFRTEAISTAARHARADAATLAEAAGVTLVRPLSITLDNASSRPQPPSNMARAMAASESAAPPLTPGDVTVVATVSIVYEIKPRD